MSWRVIYVHTKYWSELNSPPGFFLFVFSDGYKVRYSISANACTLLYLYLNLYLNLSESVFDLLL